ncbi:unnamed protein product [Tetraodon nigroviridis]|uniref:(spotted green pufferfish) hypothetical protein n=1 Tax=Tetraodon nigroviridis TaxID=99883 RepID=Q4RR48_TETNG|nr:unnamed protein product [Tetraodon nigroviridis]
MMWIQTFSDTSRLNTLCFASPVRLPPPPPRYSRKCCKLDNEEMGWNRDFAGTGHKASKLRQRPGADEVSPESWRQRRKGVVGGSSFLAPDAAQEKRQHGKCDYSLPNVRKSYLFCGLLDCTFLRWQIQGGTMQMRLTASSLCCHPARGRAL